MRKTYVWIRIVAIFVVISLVVGSGFFWLGTMFGNRRGMVWNNRNNPMNSFLFSGPYETTTHTLEAFEELLLDISLLHVSIRNGDKFGLELVNVPKDTIQFDQTKTVLTIRSEYKPFIDYGKNSRGKVILTIPKGVTVKKTTLELSMGELFIDHLETDEMKIDSSMTSIQASDVTTHSLIINSSMADIELQGSFLGKTKISNSMANVKLILTGLMEDYGFNISNSMGSIHFDGKELSGWSNESSENTDAENFVTIDNSMGNVEIRSKRN